MKERAAGVNAEALLESDSKKNAIAIVLLLGLFLIFLFLCPFFERLGEEDDNMELFHFEGYGNYLMN